MTLNEAMTDGGYKQVLTDVSFEDAMKYAEKQDELYAVHSFCIRLNDTELLLMFSGREMIYEDLENINNRFCDLRYRMTHEFYGIDLPPTWYIWNCETDKVRLFDRDAENCRGALCALLDLNVYD